MTASTGPTLGIKYAWGNGADGWDTENDSNLLKLDTITHICVKNYILTTPPVSPAHGDTYIPATGATGAWTGLDNEVVIYITNAWVSYTPKNGWIAKDENSDKFIGFNGTTWTDDQFGGGLEYIPLASLNGRTTQAAVAKEYMLEELHKLALLCTDCIEETGKSQFNIGLSNGAITYPASAAGMTDATGLWRFTGNGAAEGSQTIRGNSGSNKSFKLSAEPIVAIASFSIPSNLSEPYVCLSLQAGSMFGDTFYGVDLSDGVHIVAHHHDNYLYCVTRAAGVHTGSIFSRSPVGIAADTRCTFVIVATSTSVKYYMDGTLLATHTTNIPTVDLVASFGSLDHGAAPFFGHTLNTDLLQFFRLYKTTPRDLGIPNITY